MGLIEFLKPNRAKIVYFLFMIVVAPFPYFISLETLSQYEVKWLWGFPPIVSLIYDYLPTSLQELNAGIFEISEIKTTFYWIPTYALFIFLLSCVIGLIVDKIRVRYKIMTFRGLLWRKLEKKKEEPKKEKEKEEEPKKEKKEEEPEEEKKEEPEEIGGASDETIKEMANLIREEETFLKEQKKEFQKFLDDMNVKKLKGMGIDIKKNKIICSGCKKWKTLPKGELLELMGKHGFDVIWEYKCPRCREKKEASKLRFFRE